MHGAWYRVLTLDGEVIEKMQFRQGAFRGLRGRVIELPRVERVAVRFAPGVAGGADRWLVVNANPGAQAPGDRPPVFERRRQRADTPKAPRRAYGELPAALLVRLDEDGPQSTADLAERLPGHSAATIRAALSRMTHAQTVSRTADGKRWQIGAPVADRAPTTGLPLKEEAWTPEPWVHPIRRRALGLPVASPVRARGAA